MPCFYPPYSFRFRSEPALSFVLRASDIYFARHIVSCSRIFSSELYRCIYNGEVLTNKQYSVSSGEVFKWNKMLTALYRNGLHTHLRVFWLLLFLFGIFVSSCRLGLFEDSNADGSSAGQDEVPTSLAWLPIFCDRNISAPHVYRDLSRKNPSVIEGPSVVID